MPAIDPTVPPFTVRTAARRAPGGPPPLHTAGASVSTWCPGRPARERVHRARVAPHMSACTGPGSPRHVSMCTAPRVAAGQLTPSCPSLPASAHGEHLPAAHQQAHTRPHPRSCTFGQSGARDVPFTWAQTARSPRRGGCPARLISHARSAGGMRFPYPGSRRRSWKESAPMGAVSYQDLGRIRPRSGDQGVCVFSRAGFGHKLLDQRRGGGRGGAGEGREGRAGVSGRGGGPGGGAGSSATCAAGPGRSW